MPDQFHPCLLIPYYNHGSTLPEVVTLLLAYSCPILIVDDGSKPSDRDIASSLADSHDLVTLLRLESNQGKGAAMSHGMHYAKRNGYTHALQIDADLQHDTADVSTLLQHAEAHQDHLILAYPVFGKEAPIERVWGRKLTTLMIQLQTMSLKAKDGLFGFRVYPLAQTVSILESSTVSSRMAFDPEILIRLIRSGIPVLNVPSAVSYHENGISHFRYLQDNMAMILMHLRLIFAVLVAPFRLLIPDKSKGDWHSKREFGSPLLLRLLFLLGKLCGKRVVQLCLSPALLALLLCKRSLRTSSHHYLSRSLQQDHPPSLRQSYRHIRSFADRVTDSVFAWDTALNGSLESIPSMTRFRTRLLEGSGGIILSAHFGALEYARARFSMVPQLQIKPVMYHANSKMYREFLEQVNPRAHDNVILVESISPATILHLRDYIAAGGYLALLADRCPPYTQERTLQGNLFGECISLPYGPFLLAELLKVDVLTLFCTWHDDKHLQFEWQDITPSWERIPSREVRLQNMAHAYTHHLEAMCYQYPYQWYNFYDYFSDEPSAKSRIHVPAA